MTIHIATSPLSNRIFAGKVLKDGMTWGAGKIDVTGEACAAVAEHVLTNGDPVIIINHGVPVYEITVRKL